MHVMPLIEVNVWENVKLVAIKTLQEWKKKAKKVVKKWFRICGQCTNACANYDGKDYDNHTSLS